MIAHEIPFIIILNNESDHFITSGEISDKVGTNFQKLERLSYRIDTCIHWISSTLVNTGVDPIR